MSDAQVEHCAVCLTPLDDGHLAGAGIMLFHDACLPSCRFCTRRYVISESGWDFRGNAEWSDELGYIQHLDQAACPDCSDDGGRRDYGSGW